MIKDAKCIWCNKEMQIGYEIKNMDDFLLQRFRLFLYFLLEFHEINPIQEYFTDIGWNRALFSEIICKDCMDVLTKYLKINKEVQ